MRLMPRNILKLIAVFIVGAVGGIFADQILWPYFVERPLFYQYKLEQSPVYLTERKEVVIQENTALQESIEKVEKAVIKVRSQTAEGAVLEGSGLVLTSDGLIVTLAELVPQGSAFSFLVQGKPVAFQILKRDLNYNLALVKLEAANFQSVSFADLNKTKLGERVFLVGVLKENKIIVNEGIIKNLDKNLIQTNIKEDVSLRGTPLFNIQGEVLGLNTIKEGEVLSIPVSLIREFSGF